MEYPYTVIIEFDDKDTRMPNSEFNTTSYDIAEDLFWKCVNQLKKEVSGGSVIWSQRTIIKHVDTPDTINAQIIYKLEKYP